MGWFILKHIFATIFSFINFRRLSDQEKDLEILILRQQLSILQRKQKHPIRPSRVEKLTLGVLTNKLKRTTHKTANQLRGVIRIFQPETVLRWHRELVCRKWTYPNRNKGGRPPIGKETESLILRLARENSRLGYGKIVGELLKLGFQVSLTTVRNVLDRYGIQPASVRNGSIGWRHLITHYKEQILACDFFTVETIWLETIYVLFFIELGSRQVHFAGITTNPNQVWVTQQARQLVWELSDREKPFQFLIYDNDGSFCPAFDAVFRSEGFHVIPTPAYRARTSSQVIYSRKTVTFLRSKWVGTEWNRILPTEKKRLLQLVIEAVLVREGALVGMQPSVAYHSLFGECCSSGDDGCRPIFM
jgi:putative transposase